MPALSFSKLSYAQTQNRRVRRRWRLFFDEIGKLQNLRELAEL
jgi:hypothetical protein